MKKTLHHPDTNKVRLRNQNKKDYPKCYTDPRSSQLGSTTDQLETKQHNECESHRAPPWAWLLLLHGSTAPASWVWKYMWVTGTQQSHTLAIQTIEAYRKGKCMMWSYNKRLAYLGANIHKWEREEKAKARSMNYDQEVILEQPTTNITPTPCSLLGPRREETITVTYAVDAF